MNNRIDHPPLEYIIYLGSFDPFCMHHYRVLKSLQSLVDPSIIFSIAPAGSSKTKKLSSHYDRVRFIQKFLESEEEARSNVCIQAYAYYTVYELLQETCQWGDKFGLLMGVDNYIDMPNWYNFEELRTIPTFVSNRQGFYAPSQLHAQNHYLLDFHILGSATEVRKLLEPPKLSEGNMKILRQSFPNDSLIRSCHKIYKNKE